MLCKKAGRIRRWIGLCTPVMGVMLWAASLLHEYGRLKEISVLNDLSDRQSTRRRQLAWVAGRGRKPADVWVTAWKNVKQNRSAPGPDEITRAEFSEWMRPRSQAMRQQLLEGTNRPETVRRKTIAKRKPLLD